MAKRVRQIIKIDEEKCNGCGMCVPACREGALQIVDGKAKMISEKYCDGLGNCLGECPQDAISFETREAEEFDESAVTASIAERDEAIQNAAATVHGCSHSGELSGSPSAKIIDRTKEAHVEKSNEAVNAVSELRQWPVKLYLVNPTASYFKNADLLLLADCAAVAYGSLHPDFLRGRVVVSGCPKFDDVQIYLEKLTDIMQKNEIHSITVLQMEVPCCSGMLRLAQLANTAAGKHVMIKAITIGLNGEIKE